MLIPVPNVLMLDSLPKMVFVFLSVETVLLWLGKNVMTGTLFLMMVVLQLVKKRLLLQGVETVLSLALNNVMIRMLFLRMVAQTVR